jgi:uncharacterized protein (DUF427 family)
MTERIEPGPDQESAWDYPRPPRVEPTGRHVVVKVGGVAVADTTQAVRLLETAHPPVYYIPPQHVRLELMTLSPLHTECEYKGTASYYDLSLDGKTVRNAAWVYDRSEARLREPPRADRLLSRPGGRGVRRRRARDAAARQLLRRLDHERRRRAVQRRARQLELVGDSLVRRFDPARVPTRYGKEVFVRMPQCAWHPSVETNVSCPDCGRYMCPKDMVDSPVGYKCKECGRARIKRGGVKPAQLVRAAIYGLLVALLAAPFARFVPFFLVGAIVYGGVVGEAARRGGGGHRSWEFAAIAAACALLGAGVVGAFLGSSLSFLVAGPIVAAAYVVSARW